MYARGTVRPIAPSVLVVLALSLSWGLGVPGCAGPSATAASPTAEPEPATASPRAPTIAPETAFQTLEQQLGQTPLRLRFELRAEGAVVASLAGTLAIADELDLRVEGAFAGGEHDLRMWTAGDRLRAGAGADGALALDVPRPPELARALVIGLARMGLLHNVARAIAGRAPDHAEGGVSEWVQVTELAPVEAGGDAGLRYVLVVGGERSGEGTLWLDAHGRPVRRELIVEFPDAQMKVEERYEWLEPLPAAG